LHLHFGQFRLFEASNIGAAAKCGAISVPGTASLMTPIRAGRWRTNPVWKELIMTEHSLWRFSRALHRAINERQHEELEALIDDDVDWAVYGPIDMFPFFGARRGKAAVLEVIRRVADNIRVHRFDRESIMLGADSAASMMRYSLTMLDANKPISLRLAQFAQFKAGKLASIRILVDTFDLVEQALGHPIHLPRIAS
jgi:ketosteroid isomerase-like protein